MPLELSEGDALGMVRELASDTDRIVLLPHAIQRCKQRKITRRQVELCCLKGTISEGPFLNAHGHWQINLYRHMAGEEITCVVAIDWATRLLVITTF